MRHGPGHVTIAVGVFFAGLSTRKTALTNAGCPVTHQAILDWGRRFGCMMEQYLELLRPHLGEAWRTDEPYLMIRGGRKYLFAMLYIKTCYWIARQVATHKGTDDVRPVFRRAMSCRCLSWMARPILPRGTGARRLKSEDSAMLSGLQVCHNHIRPHLAPDRTPGEAAGIRAGGSNPWLAIIESAVKFAARVEANPTD